MLGNFVFSINIVLPIFAVLFAGYLLKRKGFLGEEFFRTGNKLVFNIALPANLFMSVYESDLTAVADAPFGVFAVATTIVSFLLIWLLAELFIKDKPLIGTFVQGAFRGNFAILGLPLLHNVIGEENSAKSVLIISLVVPVYNVLSILVLALRSKERQRQNVAGIALSIVKNPLIVSIAAGVLLSLLKPYLGLPSALTKTAGYFSSLSTPLALLCLGGCIDFRRPGKRFRLAAISTAIKLLVLPLIFVPLAYMLGFRGNDLTVLLITFGVPSAVSGYTMAVQMGGDEYMSSTIVMLSTALSVVTLTAFIYAFRALEII